MRRLDGKRALVTGGASGIGAATARAVAARGATVIVADREEQAGLQIAAEVQGEFYPLDVGDSNAWASVPEVDLAHLNAGVVTARVPVSLDDLDANNWQRVRAVNIDGVALGVVAAIAGMTRRGGGSIVCTASGAGLGVFPPDPFYGASKHAVIGLARSIAPLLADREITINVVCPPRTDTPLARMVKQAPDTTGRSRLSAQAVGDITAAILAGEGVDGATGQVYRIESDGSWRAHQFLGELGPPPT